MPQARLYSCSSIREGCKGEGVRGSEEERQDLCQLLYAAITLAVFIAHLIECTLQPTVIIKRWECQIRSRDTIGGKFIFLQKGSHLWKWIQDESQSLAFLSLSFVPRRGSSETFEYEQLEAETMSIQLGNTHRIPKAFIFSEGKGWGPPGFCCHFAKKTDFSCDSQKPLFFKKIKDSLY